MNGDSSGLTYRTMLCLPIRGGGCNGSSDVLGVISLVNKEPTGDPCSRFTENDERFAEAFAVFCGMAIRNAQEYERAVLSEARQVHYSRICGPPTSFYFSCVFSQAVRGL